MILKTKIITILCLVVTIAVALMSSVVLNVQRDRFFDHEQEDIATIVNLIVRGIEDSMEEGNTERVQSILQNIGKDEEILGLRIISTNGTILKSKDPGEIGAKSENFSSMDIDKSVTSTNQLENRMTMTSPILNKPECYGCHSENIKVNGIVELSYNLESSNEYMLSVKRFYIGANLFLILVVASLLTFLFSRYITLPLKNLLDTIRSVEGGDWEARTSVTGSDELGTIGSSLNGMIDEVKRLYEKNLKKEKEISKARIELGHKRAFEELTSQLQFKVKEVETANKAVVSLSKELKHKNLELEKLVERLKKINEIGRFLSSIIETEELIKLIIKITSELLGAEKGSIHISKEGNTNLTLQYVQGLGVESLSDPAKDFHPVYGKLLTDGNPLFMSPANGNGSTIEGQPEYEDSFLGVPLKLKGQIVGGLLLQKKLDNTSFTPEDLELLTTLANQAMVAIENAWLYENVKSNYFGTIQALVNALEANDRYTRGHSERVRYMSAELARFIGLDQREIEVLEHAAILHDIGKIGIDSVILNKAGKLSSTEFSLIKAHPLIGDEILGPIGRLGSVRTTIIQHHERYDGSGYPYGIAGEEISLKARILSVVDTFDAMMTDRSYRKALTLDRTIEELRSNAGTQFDPVVTSAFIQMLEHKGADFITSAGYSIM